MRSQVEEQVFYSLLETGVRDDPYYSIGGKSEQLLNQWSKSKESLFRLFGNKLKVSIPMETTADLNIYLEAIGKLESELKQNPSYNLVRIVARSFLISNSKSIENIVGNIIRERDIVIGNKTFAIGTKISKFFSSLVPKELQGEFNTAYSMFLQSLQTTGELVVSIDPVDFLMMSENKSNWSSCHSMFGEFRAGVLSYMVDNHTAIAYLSSNRQSHYTDFGIDWNNKKWRQVVHINPLEGVFIQGKSYPALSPICSIGIKSILTELMDMKDPVETGNESKIQSLMQDYYSDEYEETTLHYNDVLKNWYSGDGVVAVAEKGVDLYGLDTMFIGGEVKCLNDDCDQVLTYSNHFFCYECVDEEY